MGSLISFVSRRTMMDNTTTGSNQDYFDDGAPEPEQEQPTGPVKKITISVGSDPHFVDDLDTLVKYYYNALDKMAYVSASGILRKLVREEMIRLGLREVEDAKEEGDNNG